MNHTALLAVAELAPGLSEAELRLLIELTRRGLDAPDFTFRASIRDLVRATKLAKSAIQRAQVSLAERSVILMRSGTATHPTAYRLTYMDTVRLTASGGVPSTGTPLCLPKAHGVPTGGTPLYLPEAQGVPAGGTPDVDSTTLFPLDPPPLDIEKSNDVTTIDRLLRATPEKCDPEDLRKLRDYVHGYQLKFGREPHAHAPDNRILAQLLSIAPLGALINLVHDLMAERRPPGHSYAWYVTVALQRIHGISPKVQAEHRTRLKLVRRGDASASTVADTLDTRDLVADLAARKSMFGGKR